MVVTRREQPLLPELVWARFLTTSQIQRLVPFPSRRRAQKRLRLLLDHGHVEALLQADALHRDNLWRASQRTLSRLIDEGVLDAGTTLGRVNPRSQKIRHAIAIREVAVTFLAARRDGLVEIGDLRLDDELAAEPIFRDARIVPDGYAVLGAGGLSVTCLWEVNGLAQPLAQLRRKLDAYARARAAGRPLFSGPDLAVLIVTESPGRLAHVQALSVGIPGTLPTAVCLLRDARDAHGLLRLIGFDTSFRPIT